MSLIAEIRSRRMVFAFFCWWANERMGGGALESSWNVDSDSAIGRNFPSKIHEVRSAYFWLLSLIKNTRVSKAVLWCVYLLLESLQ